MYPSVRGLVTLFWGSPKKKQITTSLAEMASCVYTPLYELVLFFFLSLRISIQSFLSKFAVFSLAVFLLVRGRETWQLVLNGGQRESAGFWQAPDVPASVRRPGNRIFSHRPVLHSFHLQLVLNSLLYLHICIERNKTQSNPIPFRGLVGPFSYIF